VALPALTILALGAAVGGWRYDSLQTTIPDFLGYDVDAAPRVPTNFLAAFEPVLIQAGITLLFPVLVLVLLRARPALDAARPVGSARRYRVYLRDTARLLLLSAACLNLGLFVAELQLWEIVGASTGWRVVSYLPLAAMLGAWLVWGVRVGQGGHRLPALPGEQQEDSGLTQRDDDRHWFLAGTVYVNRDDRAVLKQSRIGVYWSLNLGHPVAWVLGAALLTIAVLAAFGVIHLPMRHNAF
jgi:uncharacterized membrane protein